jgi:N-acyl-D-aspartate/D-glutamate deacylase
MALDLLIVGGVVVDGTGGPAYPADIGIEGDCIRLVQPGSHSNRPAAEKVMDAYGLTVTPGFIDSHSHSDVTGLRDPDFDAKIRQGVTTDVIGICGFSMAPVDRITLPLFDRYLSAITAGFPVGYEWENFAEYLAQIRNSPLPTNMLPFVGHGTVRMAVMGFDRRPPSSAELKRMKGMVEEAMGAGARGLSSGLVYPPGAYATAQELLSLLEPVAAAGGIYSTHIRNESHALEEAIVEAIKTARSAGVPLVISHLKAMGPRNWDKVDRVLHHVEQARAAGQKVVFDQYPYTACSTLLSALVPPWAHEGGMGQLLQRLESGPDRAKIRHAVEEINDGTWQNFVLDAGGWSGIIACTVPWGEEFEGKSFSVIAGETGKPPFDILAELLIELEGSGTVVAHTMSEENVEKIMRHPAHLFGSDSNPCEGKPHPRLYGSFIRALTHFVRNRKVLSLEEAVAKMTGRTASFYGLQERGIIAPGKRADLAVFNYLTLKDNATFADPRRHPDGMKAVILNGRVVVQDGQRAARGGGRVLSRGEG